MHKLIFKFSSIETESEFFSSQHQHRTVTTECTLQKFIKIRGLPDDAASIILQNIVPNIDKVYAYFKIKCHMRGNPINLAAGRRRETSRERDATWRWMIFEEISRDVKKAHSIR